MIPDGFTTCHLCGWEVIDVQGGKGYLWDADKQDDHPIDSGRLWTFQPRKMERVGGVPKRVDDWHRHWYRVFSSEVRSDTWLLWPHEYTCSDQGYWQEWHKEMAERKASITRQVAEQQAKVTAEQASRPCAICHGPTCEFVCPRTTRLVRHLNRKLDTSVTLAGKHFHDGYEGPLFGDKTLAWCHVTHETGALPKDDLTHITVEWSQHCDLDARKVTGADIDAL